MENKGVDAAKKRKKATDPIEVEKADSGQEVVIEEVAGSDEVEMNIARILEKIERFTQQVSELLEAGKTMFKDLSAEFEERMIGIHREQIEKWQHEIKELRSLDALNEEANARLHNAQYLLRSIHVDSSS
ncbi:hypothetical protein MRB53_003450 [Persea americana]|uniref:Uncharacterized protein n=1 Tax=Persea americana TaxID=3435 RepID=A0ACC2MX93_PERAE|nr:hypothetical protein MRB53_003450 [Persea americana]|eukprot:TRINITY_DN41707_c0_g1_i1.p1 TRINITY_DN41707_c0_g1~~TRINITY_DN41707_c0_g1_i1.p1  ORF type:complete len:130 (-),score=32.12 TRINITY_DN41707_c0_g1_i1:236-625(-)